MSYLALLLPVLLIGALIAALVILRRHLFGEAETRPPDPVPDAAAGPGGMPKMTLPSAAKGERAGEDRGPTLTPARLYPRRPLTAGQKAVFARLLKALPGYVVLPKITYDHFLEARDGSPSENNSLQQRAAQHLADFVICDRSLRVLLVCQIEDGSHSPARLLEREKMLKKTGLRLLRWKAEKPPDPTKLFKTVETLEKLQNGGAQAKAHGDASS